MRSATLIRSARRRAGLTLERVVRACGLELRVEIEAPDPAEIASIQRNLALTPTERLDQLVRTVAFARAGRAAIKKRHA